jgi:hypothetical protein
MATVWYRGMWAVDLTDDQYEQGLAEARRRGSTHYTIWRRLVDAGVPVRDAGGRPHASLCATAIRETLLVEAGV